MPEEIEVPTEHLHETLHEKAQEGGGPPWIQGVALSAASGTPSTSETARWLCCASYPASRISLTTSSGLWPPRAVARIHSRNSGRVL